MSPDEKTELKLNVGKIPEIMRDNTDRNRTSLLLLPVTVSNSER